MKEKEVQIGLQIQYALIDDKAVILSCRGFHREINLPADLEGYPVTEIGAYAFSSPREGIELLPEGTPIYTKTIPELIAPGSFEQDLWGKNIEKIHLPEGIKVIGKYAFYNCTGLTGLTLYAGKVQIENGAFMNCDKLEAITMMASPEEQTCLPALLSEIQGEVSVVFYFQEGNAQVIFPEYYEESVENTPARVFQYLLHGAGYRYRQCFDKGALKLADYDAVFLSPEIQTETETALRIAFKRLSSPYGLSRRSRENYLNYIGNNQVRALNQFIEENKGKELNFLLGFDIFTEDTLESALEVAAKLKRADCLRILMEVRRLRFPPKEKSFYL
jgi:hypothetical protein